MRLPSILTFILVVSRAVHAGYLERSVFHQQEYSGAELYPSVWLQQPHAGASIDHNIFWSYSGREDVAVNTDQIDFFDQAKFDQLMLELNNLVNPEQQTHFPHSGESLLLTDIDFSPNIVELDENVQITEEFNDHLAIVQMADFPISPVNLDHVLNVQTWCNFNDDQHQVYGEKSIINEAIPSQTPSVEHETHDNIIIDEFFNNDLLDIVQNAKRRRVFDYEVADLPSTCASAVMTESSQSGVDFSISCAAAQEVSRDNGNIPTEPELDLNLNSIQENYEILCGLIGKEQDPQELSFLKASIPDSNHTGGKTPAPVTVKLNGEELYISEWSQIVSAKSTLVKLILVARFYQKIHPIWAELRWNKKVHRTLQDQYYQARSILQCLKNCCGNNVVKFQEGRENPFYHSKFKIRSCPDHDPLNISNEPDRDDEDSCKVPKESEIDLNLKSIEENYETLCKIFGKEMNATELTELKGLLFKGIPNNGNRRDPITVNVNGRSISLPEWKQIRSANSSLVKMIYVMRFCQKLDAIWPSLDVRQRDVLLQRKYISARAVLKCFRSCCNHNLVEFCRRWGNPFKFCDFSFKCCSARKGRPITSPFK